MYLKRWDRIDTLGRFEAKRERHVLIEEAQRAVADYLGVEPMFDNSPFKMKDGRTVKVFHRIDPRYEDLILPQNAGGHADIYVVTKPKKAGGIDMLGWKDHMTLMAMPVRDFGRGKPVPWCKRAQLEPMEELR